MNKNSMRKNQWSQKKKNKIMLSIQNNLIKQFKKKYK